MSEIEKDLAKLKELAYLSMGDGSMTKHWYHGIKAGVEALEKQIPKKVYHFLDDDTFETTCCGIDVTNKDYTYCPECGCKLGEVEDVEGSGSDE